MHKSIGHGSEMNSSLDFTPIYIWGSGLSSDDQRTSADSDDLNAGVMISGQ